MHVSVCVCVCRGGLGRGGRGGECHISILQARCSIPTFLPQPLDKAHTSHLNCLPCLVGRDGVERA